jgi:hypothetical protein
MAVERQNHEHGNLVVSHDFHQKTKLPAPARESRDYFGAAMDKLGKRNQQVATKAVIDEDSGITYKRFVRMGGGRGPKGRILPSRIYMLKPYYEDFDDDYGYYPYPTAGWAELATQALMHAGGLGHMSQVVHAHLPKGGSPVLAVEIAPKVQRIGNFHSRNIVTDTSREDAAKLAALDFLIGNGDRHGFNLLARMSTDSDSDPDQTIDSLLAIDHGRSFHYKVAAFGDSHDNLLDYFKHDAYNLFDLESPYHTHDVMHSIAGWWKQHGPAMKIAMRQQTKGIKVPGMADNIDTQFSMRANALDKMVGTLKRLGHKAYNSKKPNKRAYAELNVPVDVHTVRGKPWNADVLDGPRKVVTLATNGFDFKTKRDTQGNTVREEQEG